MPHSESIMMLKFMDFIRKRNDITFPGEWNGIDEIDEDEFYDESEEDYLE